MKLRLTVLSWRQVIRAEVQPLRRTIVHVPHLPAHQVGEDKVGRIQHRCAGTEILAEQNAPGFPLNRLRRVGINPVLLQEYSRVCQTETVNGLLHIPHGEQRPPAVGQRVKHAVLHLVGVLILVHHHLPVASGHHLRQGRGAAVLSQKQAHRVMLLVREVRHVPPQLFFLIGR